jgi:antitoxin ParD1/3/4
MDPMANVEKISIALSPELLDTVRQAVASGQYASSSEVIREALRDWTRRQPLRRQEIERLRKAWAEGVASGQAAEDLDMAEVKRKARLRLGRSAPDG